MRRKQFVLIFSKDPASADIVREDGVTIRGGENVNLVEGVDCSYQWEKRKDVVEEVEGKVLAVGTKTALSSYSVSLEGVLRREQTGEPKLGTRKQEIEKERLRQLNAQAINLQGVAEHLVEGGADLAAQALRPVIRLPKRRPTERLQEIRRVLENLDCFKAGNGKTELVTGHKVYAPTGVLAVYRQRYKLMPKKHFAKLMTVLLPVKIVIMDGLSVTGTRYCEGIPASLIETLVLYVSAACRKAKGNPDEDNYDPHSIIRNYIYNCRRKAKKNENENENVEIDGVQDEVFVNVHNEVNEVVLVPAVLEVPAAAVRDAAVPAEPTASSSTPAPVTVPWSPQPGPSCTPDYYFAPPNTQSTNKG